MMWRITTQHIRPHDNSHLSDSWTKWFIRQSLILKKKKLKSIASHLVTLLALGQDGQETLGQGCSIKAYFLDIDLKYCIYEGF